MQHTAVVLYGKKGGAGSHETMPPTHTAPSADIVQHKAVVLVALNARWMVSQVALYNEMGGVTGVALGGGYPHSCQWSYGESGLMERQDTRNGVTVGSS